MPLEEALRGHHLHFGIGRIVLHPLLAFGQASVSPVSQMPMKPRRFASASEVRPDDQTSPGRERRGMIGAVERHGLADLGGAGDDGPARAEALLPGFRQFARELRARAIAASALLGLCSISRTAMRGAAASVASDSTSQIAVMRNKAPAGMRSEGIATSASGTRKNSEMPQSVFI